MSICAVIPLTIVWWKKFILIISVYKYTNTAKPCQLPNTKLFFIHADLIYKTYSYSNYVKMQ